MGFSAVIFGRARLFSWLRGGSLMTGGSVYKTVRMTEGGAMILSQSVSQPHQTGVFTGVSWSWCDLTVQEDTRPTGGCSVTCWHHHHHTNTTDDLAANTWQSSVSPLDSPRNLSLSPQVSSECLFLLSASSSLSPLRPNQWGHILSSKIALTSHLSSSLLLSFAPCRNYWGEAWIINNMISDRNTCLECFQVLTGNRRQRGCLQPGPW